MNTQEMLQGVKNYIDTQDAGLIYDISEANAESGIPAIYSDLLAALGPSGANVPTSVRSGGMTVKFIQQLYTVVKTTSSSAPSGGTSINSDPGIGNGSAYTAADLSAFSSLPTTSSVVYYLSDGESTPTYTIWTISKNAIASCPYAQWRYLGTSTSTGFTTIANWQGVTSEIKSGSKDLVESGAVAEELALGAVYDVSAKNPKAGPNNDGKFTLEYILSHADTLIPTERRHGGMTISFVHSIDNKYMQYRLMADSWSTDTAEWSFCGDDVLVENPEFVYVKTDSEGKILWAIKIDGGIYYGAGVPQQVKDYIEKKISSLSLDEYEDIVAFLNDYLGSDTTLKVMIDGINAQIATKVDKVEGKSLIDAEYASTKSTIENPEFIEVTTDSEDKVLEGIQQDGTKVIGGDIKVLGNMEVSGVSYKVINNSEYFAAWVDAEDKVIFGLKADGKTYVGDADFLDDIENIKDFLQNITDKNIDWNALSSITAVENPEFIDVKTDGEGKLLSSRNLKGVKKEYVGFETPMISIDGATASNINDVEERTEVKTDSEGKIINYRDKNGVLHEEAGIEAEELHTNHLTLSNAGMSEFQQDLIKAGFNPKMPIDWSNVKELHLPIPRTCAKINLIVNSLPVTKASDYEGYVEYIDFDGNYFKKKMVLNAQGSSSLAYIEKNYTLDIDDKSKIQFGNWVSQDSFHLKAYYIDVFRGINNICYKWTNKIIEHLGCRVNRVLNDTSSITTSNGTGIFTTDFGSSALCQPDGFPVEVYHNGTYYGLYALNLKKNRDNYQMKKDNYTQALLDGVINGSTFFGGTIDWTQFELRNPKKLILEDGTTEYDGDNPAEIIGTDSPNYDSSNTDHVNTAVTKAMIEEVADCVATISSMPISTPQEIQEVKTLFESHYDIEMIKCYFILSNVIYHDDGFSKNWIWTIYNGMAAPTFYDMDSVFGRIWYGSGMWGNNTTTHIIGTDEYDLQAHNSPSNIIANLYKDELDTMYKDLRDNGYISVPAIMSQIYEWIGAQTLEAIQRNLKKWTAIPSYRADGGSYPPPLSYSAGHQTEGMYDCPARVEKWLTARLARLDNYFNYTSN